MRKRTEPELTPRELRSRITKARHWQSLHDRAGRTVAAKRVAGQILRLRLLLRRAEMEVLNG